MEKDILKELGLDGELPPAREDIAPIRKIADPPKKTHCPYCLSEINPRAVVCAVCHRDQPGFKDRSNTQNECHPGLAAVMSVVLPGLGQIYRGKIIGGFCWMIIVPLGYLLLIVPGIALHVLCVTNAYCYE